MNLYGIQLDAMMALLGVIALLGDAFFPASNRNRLGYFLAAAVGALLVYSFTLTPVDHALFHQMYRLDAFALYFKRIFLLATVVVLIMAVNFSGRTEGSEGELYSLLLFCSTGMLVLGSVNDFVLLFVALELVTISFYALTSYMHRHFASLEAGTKYLVLGSLSSGFIVYGVTYIFGTAGTTNFDTLAATLRSQAVSGPAFTFGMLLVLAGLGFKIASVPFQVWAPDVYQGAPTPVTAFLAVGSKAAGFALLLRVLLAGLLPMQHVWSSLFLILSAATLLYGNLGALPQTDIKRLFGYSSIGHAGYLLMGVTAVSAIGTAAVMFYLTQYAFTSLCAFLVIVAVENATGGNAIRNYRGLYKRSPLLTAALFIALLSLAGIPPLSGFFGKFLLFLAVINRAAGDWHYYVLAGIAAVTAVISLYFYLSVARVITIDSGDDSTPITVSGPMRLALYVCMTAIVLLGIFQGPLVDASRHAAAVFGLK